MSFSRKIAIENQFTTFDYNTFENIKEVGKGGFGEVTKAYWNTSNKYVALKCLHGLNDDNDDEIYKQFMKESRNISAVQHDNIINFYGVSIDTSTERYYLVLQYAEDGDLRTYLRNNFEKLDWNAKISMAKDIARGLSHIHQKEIVHRDLHSKNILVHEGRLLISDLGLSKQLDAKSNSIAGGVAAYTDPEYLRNPQTYKRSKTSDIYSLGVLLWELSSGKPPFHKIPDFAIPMEVTSGKREEHIRETPIDYINVYSSAWEDDPNMRPTIEKICDSLENIELENVHNIPSEMIQLKNDENISINEDIISNRSETSSKSNLSEHRETHIDHVNIYWEDDPNLRPTIPTIEKICDSLENIELENDHNIPSKNIQLKNDENSEDTVPNELSETSSLKLNLSKWKSGFSIDETPKKSQDDATHEKDANILNPETAKIALSVLGVVGDAVQPYLPLFTIVNIIISEINNIYDHAKCNKNICNSLMDRIDAAEREIKNLERRKKENEKNFLNAGYLEAFHRFIEVLKNIKLFMSHVSTLAGFQEYNLTNINYITAIEEKFESLINEFESAMNNLHFTTSLCNDDQKKIDKESLISDLEEMAKFLSIVDPNKQDNTVVKEIMSIKNQLDGSEPSTTTLITVDEIDPKELKDPQVGRPDDQRGSTIMRKVLSNREDVACKTKIIDSEGQKTKALLAILGKLKSENILKFYGLSKVEDQNVMVFEWADFGSLQEVYMKYDIGWRSKVQIALDICRGLVFLQKCEILHHDIRCANIMVTKELVPKLSNFKYARYNRQETTDIKDVTNILRWMAPEKMGNVKYTFKCEIFSFGMLLWELLFQKIPYDDKDMNQIKEHVLKGGREKITRHFSSQENQTIQNKFFNIIIAAWQQDAEMRASLMETFLKLQGLAASYPIDKSPTLNLLKPIGALNLDG